MSLLAWPSAFIRLAVATWVVSRTFLGRPNLVPFAWEACRLVAVVMIHRKARMSAVIG
jgi:hypothetical protein